MFGLAAQPLPRRAEGTYRDGAQWKPAASSGGGTTGDAWPEPKPLPLGLLPVAPLDSHIFLAASPLGSKTLPNGCSAADYVAVSAMTALGALIGRRVGIKPQVKTDWVEVPNIWGCLYRSAGNV